MSKYAKRGEKMFHNIPKNIVVAGRIVRQKVMATLARDGGNRGGKLFPLCPTLWDILAVYLQSKHKRKYDYDIPTLTPSSPDGTT
jgi:hypothetical protein